MKDGKFIVLLITAVFIALAGYVLMNEKRVHQSSMDHTIVINDADIRSSESDSATVTTTTKTKKSQKTSTATRKTSATKTPSHTTTTAPPPTEPEVLYFDLNKVTADELMKIKGIGPSLAEAIIDYRESNGGFRNLEELINVHGIGEATFASISPYLYVENPIYDEPDAPPEETEPVSDTYEETSEEYQDIPAETEHIPTLEENVPININTADTQILMLLPGVDEAIAQRIIEFRENCNGFNHVYELMLIEGLSREKVAAIIDFVTTGDPDELK